MLKGCRREMIVLHTRESHVFESAYFLLRRERAPLSGQDMVAEANRIIGVGEQRLEKRRAGRGMLSFLLGLLCGAGVFALAWCIIAL